MSEKVGIGIDFGMNSLGVSYDYTGQQWIQQLKLILLIQMKLARRK